MQVRSLLALLVEMDRDRYLDGSARALVAADIPSFAHVSLYDEPVGLNADRRYALAPKTAMGDAAPSVLPEILLVAEDSKQMPLPSSRTACGTNIERHSGRTQTLPDNINCRSYLLFSDTKQKFR